MGKTQGNAEVDETLLYCSEIQLPIKDWTVDRDQNRQLVKKEPLFSFMTQEGVSRMPIGAGEGGGSLFDLQ